MGHGTSPCIYVQRRVNALRTTTSSRERPLCDCPKLAGIFEKWAQLLLVTHSNQFRSLEMWYKYHWNLSQWKIFVIFFHIYIIQRNHKNVNRNQDPGDVSIEGHATWWNFIIMFCGVILQKYMHHVFFLDIIYVKKYMIGSVWYTLYARSADGTRTGKL